MRISDGLERISETYLSWAENHYVHAAVAVLLLFTVMEEVTVSINKGFTDVLTKAEHGLFFLYLNLLLLSLARLSRAYLHHRKSGSDAVD